MRSISSQNILWHNDSSCGNSGSKSFMCHMFRVCSVRQVIWEFCLAHANYGTHLILFDVSQFTSYTHLEARIDYTYFNDYLSSAITNTAVFRALSEVTTDLHEIRACIQFFSAMSFRKGLKACVIYHMLCMR